MNIVMFQAASPGRKIMIGVMILALASPFIAAQSDNRRDRKGPVLLRPGEPLPVSPEAQRVLVILHGIRLTGQEMVDDASAAYSTGYFDRVIAPTYPNWDESVPSFAPKIFAQLEGAYPNAQFVLQGYSKGGVVAEWIAERVPEAEGRIERIITVDSPLDGANLATIASDQLPGWKELESNSMTLAALRKEPINDMSAVDFIQIYAAGDRIVTQQSAFRDLTSQYGSIKRIRIQGVIHGEKQLSNLDPRKVHGLMRSYLGSHPTLYARILDGDLGAAASDGIWTIEDDECLRAGEACVKACDSITNGSWWSDCVFKCVDKYPCIVSPLIH